MPMKPMPTVNNTTTSIRSHSAYEAPNMNRPGPIAATAVKNLRTFVMLTHRRWMHMSLTTPVIWAQMNMVAYGSDEYKPFSLIENLSTSFMYLGRSVTIMKKPQLWPIWAMISDSTAGELSKWRHGMVFVSAVLVCPSTVPSSLCRYAFSSSEHHGWTSGLL